MRDRFRWARRLRDLALLPALLIPAGFAEAQSSGSAQPLNASAPPIVRAIEVRSDAEIPRQDSPEPYLAFSVGEPLTQEGIRRTLRNLYFSGFASRIEISTREVDNGVVVVVSLWANILVDEVVFTGEEGSLRRSRVRGAVPLQAGEPLVESRVLRGVFRLEDLLRENGHLSARVKLDVDVDEARKRAVVTYRLEPGPRASVGEVRTEGSLGPFGSAALTQQLRSRPGEPYRQTTVREDAERLRRWLIQQQYRSAAVELVSEDPRPDQARVDLTFRVEAGPRIVTEVQGAKLARLESQGLLPFLDDQGYDEALVLLAVDRIRAHYQRQGYYRVRVDSRQEEVDEGEGRTLRVVITVDPGPVLPLREVRLIGNQEVSDVQLTELMETSASRFLGLGGGHLVDSVLADDLDNIRSYYALHGYRGTRVGPAETEVEGQQITVTIPIVEGTRRRVGEVTFTGLKFLDEAKAREIVELERGEGFHPVLLEDSLGALRSRYADLGFVEARVSAGEEWNAEQTVVDVEIQVFEGPRQRLDRIIVTGNAKTRTPIIRHALGVRTGDPISGAEMLEMERRLYRLGIFSRVEVEMIPADLGATRRDVVVRLDEGKTRSMTYGLGYDSDDGPRGLVGFSLGNVFGRAYTFRADLRLTKDDPRFRLFFDQPWIRGWPVAMSYEAIGIEEDRESFLAIRRIARVEARRARKKNRYSLVFDYRRIRASDLAAAFFDPEAPGKPLRPGILSPLEVEDGKPRRVWVSTVAPGFALDHRDDPLEPTRGWSSSGQLQVSVPFFQAETHHLKLFFQQRHFLPLGQAGVFATSFRLGAIEPYSEPEGAGGDPVLAIPLDERLFAGGRSTHRAFPRFGLGIPGETLVVEGGAREPSGGNGLILINLEYRFPIFDTIGGVLFLDSGNVWRDWRDIRGGDLRHGIGVGVRYLSPIGPVRIDGGWNFDRRPGESSFEIHLSFGNPF